MMPAAKMMDPVMGIDIHIIQPPGPVPPVPIPHPFVGMLFDPMELAPFIGASVFVNGMPKATAGSEGKALPPHIPIGGVFVPPPPGNECEMFMGSATVLFEGEPASYLALPALSCQSVGMPSPPRAKKKPKPILKLPTSVVLPIPAGPPVLIGGPPTISLTVIGMKLAMGAAMKAAGKLRKMMKASKKAKAISARIHRAAKKAMDKLGVPPSVQNKVHKGICTVTGHPVDVATGKVFTDNVDFHLPGPIPLRWERTWYSSSQYQGPLGHGWHHAYDMALVETGNIVAIRNHDGRPLAFPRLAPGGSFHLRAEKTTLFRDNRGYALRAGRGLTYRFAPRPGAGEDWCLAGITGLSGHSIAFSYDAQGRLNAIRDSAGRLIRILADWQGRILQILGPSPDAAEGTVALATYRYDNQGDLVEARDALDQPWRFHYKNHLLVQETDRRGLSFYFVYDGREPGARCVHTWGDGGIHDHKLKYDTEAKTTTVENSLGHRTVYHVSDSGLVHRVDDARGGSSITLYNDFNELAEETDAIGRKATYEYDDLGNCVKETRFDGTVIEQTFEGDLPIWAKDAQGGEWKWEYDKVGRLLKRTDPLGGVTEYAYDRGLLASVRDPSGAETRFGFGAQGELVVLAAPGNAETRWEYDRLGRIRSVKDARGNIQRRTPDLLGRVRKVEEPDGNVREIDYDPEGNAVRVQDAHRRILLKYQGMNRVASRTEHGSTVEFLYDTEERLTGIKNEHGLVYGFELDSLGDLAVETGYDGLRRVHERDAAGQVISIEKAGGLVTRYEHDKAGRVIAILRHDGTEERYAYRADGELAAADNGVIKLAFHRNVMGRLLKEEQGSHWIESSYDTMGLRVAMKSSLGARLFVSRDEAGRVSALSAGTGEDAVAWEARFTREVAGAELERELPGGIRSRWIRDNLGRPLKQTIVSPKEFFSREYEWGVQDRLLTLRDSRHGLTSFEYDPVGNLTGSQGNDGSHLFRLPDRVGNLFRAPGQEDRKYGPAGQLLEARGSKGVTRYEYDPEGNLVRKVGPGDKVWTYAWNAAGMLEKVTRPSGEIVTMAYDAMGRRISKTFRGVVTRWVWDRNNPLHEWKEAAPAFGRQATPSASTRAATPKVREAQLAGLSSQGPPTGPGYVDESGHIWLVRPDQYRAPEPARPAEDVALDRAYASIPSGAVTWVFEPESFIPCARLKDGSRESIITDHLGVPIAMHDGEGKETWSARLDIHGQMENLRGDRDACPFRFPGQYEDLETGLYYNRHRYYDPDAGQYVSQDPLRLQGGLRMYGYVHDTNSWFDPMGWAEQSRGKDGKFLPKNPGDSVPGSDAVDEVRAEIEADPNKKVVGEEISFRDEDGQLRRYDLVVEDVNTGEVTGVEVKASETASYGKPQKEFDKKVNAGTGNIKPVGKKAQDAKIKKIDKVEVKRCK